VEECVDINVTGISLWTGAMTDTIVIDEIGEIRYLVSEIMPYNATNNSVIWRSSDTTAVTVDTIEMADGYDSVIIKAVSAGVSIITVTTVDGGFMAQCFVLVNATNTANVTGVSLNKDTINFEGVGVTETLIATISPANATDKTVVWGSSNQAVAIVTQNGVVVSISEGAAVITATTVDGGFTAQCVVNVKNVDVTGISLNKDTINFEMIGVTDSIIATVFPSNATYKTVVWGSSNQAVAIVTQNGVVVSISEGTTIITATTIDSGFTAQCVVNVSIVDVTGISLNKDTVNFEKIGATDSVIATIFPSNATYKTVVWGSSNQAAATVTQNGVIVSVADGTAIITATTVDGGFTAQCVVTVSDKSVKSVTLDKTAINLNVGATSTLTAIINPSYAANKAVTWNSSNPALAIVSATGIVTGRSNGTATITVTTNDGGLTAQCEITIGDFPLETDITADSNSVAISWEGVEGTSTYVLIIYHNGVEVARVYFDANGNVISKTAGKGAGNFSYNLTGLFNGTNYTYTLIAYNEQEEVLAEEQGGFNTLGDSPITVDLETLLSGNVALRVYPNPTSNVVNIDNPNNAEVSVFSADGTLIERTMDNCIDLSTQSAGIYILRVGNKTARVAKK
jgi:uncharacterized protein YjdB